MRGDPRDELVRKADELQAAALIVGSRGLGAFKRAFLGSCSDYIGAPYKC
jgi:nucleotide-binding universal stress UspA family protein